MTFKTHRQYSISFALIVLMILFYYKQLSMNYYLAMPIMLMASKVGALFPDLDHYWKNIHDKTYINWCINKIIHMTGGKHRSWQTHSWDICLGAVLLSVIIPKAMYNSGILNIVDRCVMQMLGLSFCTGWVSHLFSDSLTMAGTQIFCWNKKLKIKLVPKKIGTLRFNTGDTWEEFNYRLMRVMNLIIGLSSAVFPIILQFIYKGGELR